MYIYYRQCHRALKPAAVFPIEVELGINLEWYHSDADAEAGEEEVSGSIENGQSLENNPSTTVHEEDEVQSLEEQGQSSPSQQPAPVEDLLLDFEEPDSSTPPLALQNSSLEQ